MSRAIVQFGIQQPGRDYTPRPGAYALVFDAAGRVLAVEEGGYLWLPGGGLEEGETHEAGLRREMLEETGYAVEIGAELGRANEFTQDPINRRFHNKLCAFFAVRLVGEPTVPQAQGNHPAWLRPDEALGRLYDESHRWALRRALAVPAGGAHRPGSERSVS